MVLRNENGSAVRSYLLGELSEQEREQVERRLMTDDDLYQQLLLTEDDLIDAYVSGTLSKQDRAKFGERFLHVPELGQDVRSIMALRKYAIETAPPVTAGDSPSPHDFSLLNWFGELFMRPAVGISFAAALLAALALCVWLIAQNTQLRKQGEQLQAHQPPPTAPESELRERLAAERMRNEQLSADLRRQQELLAEESRKLRAAQESQDQQQTANARGQVQQSKLAAFVSLVLTPGTVRETGEMKKASLSPATREVRIRLDLAEGGYRSYRAVLRTADGREVWTAQRLRATGANFVQVNIAAGVLTPDDYQILLSGVTSSGETEELNSYYFRVSR